MPRPEPIAFMSYVRSDDEAERGRMTALRELLKDSLDASTFLVVFLTPSFFKSEACREELETFRDREKKLGRDDLILPLYYQDVRDLTRSKDELKVLIASRNWADFRPLRFDALTSPQMRKAVAGLASDIQSALGRAAPATTRARVPDTSSNTLAPLPKSGGSARGSPNEPPEPNRYV